MWMNSMVTGTGGDSAAKKNKAAGISICKGLSICRCKKASLEASPSFRKK